MESAISSFKIIATFGIIYVVTFSCLLRRWYGLAMVGLTGSIGTGKSFVAEQLRNKGLSVIDFDKICLKCAKVDSYVWHRIKNEFGEEILNDDRSINRKILSDIVFNDRDKLKRLNRIYLFPILREFASELIFHFINSRNRLFELKIVFLDCPLLFESKLHWFCSERAVVTCSRQSQIERLRLRDGVSAFKAEKIIQNQYPLEEKIKLASVVIENDKSKTETLEKIDEFVEKIKKQRYSKNCCYPTLISFVISVCSFLVLYMGLWVALSIKF